MGIMTLELPRLVKTLSKSNNTVLLFSNFNYNGVLCHLYSLRKADKNLSFSSENDEGDGERIFSFPAKKGKKKI